MNFLRKIDDWLVKATMTPKPPVVPEKSYYEDQRERMEKVGLTARDEAEKTRTSLQSKYDEASEKYLSSYSFDCRVQGDILVVESGNDRHAINIPHLVTVKFTAGLPVGDRAILTWNPYGWEISEDSPYFHYSILMDFDYTVKFPARSKPATIEFVGIGVTIHTPHSMGDEVYGKIIDALGGSNG